MIPIYIDATGLLESSLLTEGHVSDMMDFVVKEATMRYANEWQDLALQKLGGTGADYSKALVVSDDGPSRGSVTLTGWLPNALEDGWGAFDMKPGLLNGPNAKIADVKGKDGKTVGTVVYNTVPFRLGSPGAVSKGSLFSTIMPDEVYGAARKAAQTIPTAGQGMRSPGLGKEALPEKYREPATRKAPAGSRFGDYTHKFSVYEGVSRMKDPATGQNVYKSFRRVSENSDPDSWVHKGFEARHFAEKALDSMGLEDVVGASVDNYLSGLGFGG